jgi:3-(3-hydroxy-phenyl)propionate hydroxylase
VVFTQPPVEGMLRQHARSFPNVTVQLGRTVTRVTQDKHLAQLTVQAEDGSVDTILARYVVACDGASSTVRGQVGIALQDLAFDEPGLVVDVRVNDQGLAKLPTTSVQYCNPERPSSFLICPGDHRRWEISINPGEDPKELATPEGTWRLLARWLTPADGTLWRQASYRFHALVAERWREGRVFIAGDAAHQQPPFLGQGMCQGARDVANLCWKLVAVLRGEAGDALLDTYGAERKAHVTELTTRIKAIGKIVGERDPVRARERDARLLAESGGVVKPMPRQDVQPALQPGLLAADPHPARGTLFPQPWLQQPGGDAVRMDDRLGHGWRLCLAGQADAAWLAAAGTAQVPGLKTVRLGDAGFVETEGVLAAWFVRHGVTAALVRPDHYVYSVATTARQLQDQLAALRLH